MNQSPMALRVSQTVFCALGSKARTLGYSTVVHKVHNKSTVDTGELDQHKKLKDQWWQPYGPMKALHAFNMLRVPFVRDGLVQVPPDQRSCTPLTGKKILDIGCGGGILSMPLAKLGADVTGVDASDEIIEMARQHSEANPPPFGKRPTYLCTSIEDHAQTHANVYDGVVASEIIEHISNDNKELFVKSCINTLKPGGRIFFTTPSKTRVSQLTNICMAEYVLQAIPKGTHQYEKFITPNDLKLLLERNGCQVESVFGIFYNLFKNEWKWIDSTTFFFALQAIKLEEQ